MGIYVKGLDMPKGEDICLTWRIRRKDLNAVHYQPIRKKDIIEIPTPHGDLIDAKDLMIALQKCVVENDKIHRVVVDSDMETLIRDADVILEKER